MKAEQAREIADRALEELAEALKRGQSEQFRRYLAMLARFHRYSYGNVLLILAQRPDATRVAGFHAWLKLGRHVRKGEKAIGILAPMLVRTADDAKDLPSDDSKRSALRFRCVCVFDINQTDGESLPEPTRASGNPCGYAGKLRTLIVGKGIALDHDDVPMGASGVSRGGRISIRVGLEPAEEFSVLVHELAHEMLHRDSERRPCKTIRETEAESVAFVVCQSVGIDSRLAASDYIQSYSGDTATLAASLDRIQHVAAHIIAALNAPDGI